MQTHAGQRICFYVLFPVLLWKVRGGPLTVPDGSPKPCRDCFSLARAMPVLTPSPRLSSQIRIAKLSTLSGRKAWKALNTKGNSKAARLDHGHWNLKPQAIDLGRSLWSHRFGCVQMWMGLGGLGAPKHSRHFLSEWKSTDRENRTWNRCLLTAKHAK